MSTVTNSRKLGLVPPVDLAEDREEAFVDTAHYPKETVSDPAP